MGTVMSIGREDADCELTEIIEILLGSSNDERSINASRRLRKLQRVTFSKCRGCDFPATWVGGGRHGTSGIRRRRNSRYSSHTLKSACSVVVAIARYQMCSMRKPGSPDSHS